MLLQIDADEGAAAGLPVGHEEVEREQRPEVWKFQRKPASPRLASRRHVRFWLPCSRAALSWIHRLTFALHTGSARRALNDTCRPPGSSCPGSSRASTP